MKIALNFGLFLVGSVIATLRFLTAAMNEMVVNIVLFVIPTQLQVSFRSITIYRMVGDA